MTSKNLAARLFLSASLTTAGIAGATALSGCGPMTPGNRLDALGLLMDATRFMADQQEKQRQQQMQQTQQPPYQEQPQQFQVQELDDSTWVVPMYDVYCGNVKTRDCRISPNRTFASYQDTFYRLNHGSNRFDILVATRQRTYTTQTTIPATR